MPLMDRGSAARSRSIRGTDSGTGIGVRIRRQRLWTGVVGQGCRSLVSKVTTFDKVVRVRLSQVMYAFRSLP